MTHPIDDDIERTDEVVHVLDDALVVDRQWMNDNLYKVNFYIVNDDETYTAYLIQQEQPTETTLDDVEARFMETPYSAKNHYYLSDGVNCQGMTLYLANWCDINEYEYKVMYEETHTYIDILENDTWFRYDFSSQPTVTALFTKEER